MLTVTWELVQRTVQSHGPNSDFWTFVHTVPVLLESRHATEDFFWQAANNGNMLVCSVNVTLAQRAIWGFNDGYNYFVKRQRSRKRSNLVPLHEEV